MTFSIDITIPNAPNDPAEDQPKMKQNYANISGYVSVDHVAPGTLGAGRHKQTTYNSNNVPAAPANPVSIAYTDAGTADPTQNQYKWRNSKGIFPLSAIRAFGQFATGAIDIVNPWPIVDPFNIDTATTVHTVNQRYDIVFTANSFFGTAPLVFLTRSDGAAISYTFSGSTLQITTAGVTGALVNFMVIQM